MKVSEVVVCLETGSKSAAGSSIGNEFKVNTSKNWEITTSAQQCLYKHCKDVEIQPKLNMPKQPNKVLARNMPMQGPLILRNCECCKFLISYKLLNMHYRLF